MNERRDFIPEEDLSQIEKREYESVLMDRMNALFSEDKQSRDYYLEQIAACDTLAEFKSMEEKLKNLETKYKK